MRKRKLVQLKHEETEAKNESKYVVMMQSKLGVEPVSIPHFVTVSDCSAFSYHEEEESPRVCTCK